MESTLLAAVCASPESDTPRRVYADWLIDRGDPRGRFIAVQCELVSLPRDDPRRGALQGEERALLDEHEARWRALLPRARGVAWGRFERGFVSSVTLTGSEPLSDALFDAAPIWTVRLRGLEQIRIQRALQKNPARRLVRRLEIRDEGVGSGKLLAKGWDRLTELHLVHNGVENALTPPVRTLDLGNLPGVPLVHLGLDHQQIGSKGVAELRAEQISQLTSLDLRRNELKNSGAERLAPLLGAALRALSIGENAIGPKGLKALLRAAPGLQKLDLRCNPVGDKGAAMLAELLPGLQRLDVRGCEITDEGAAKLAASGIAEIDLRCNRITDGSLARDGLDLRRNEIEGAPEQLSTPGGPHPTRGERRRLRGTDHYMLSGVLADGRLAVIEPYDRQIALFDRDGLPLSRGALAEIEPTEEALFEALGFVPDDVEIAANDDGPWPLEAGTIWSIEDAETAEYYRREVSSGEYAVQHGRWCYDHGRCHST